MVNIGASNVLGIVGLISVSVSFLIIGYAGMVSQNKELTPKLKLGKTLAEILCAAAVIVIAIGLITVPSHNEGFMDDGEDLSSFSENAVLADGPAPQATPSTY